MRTVILIVACSAVLTTASAAWRVETVDDSGFVGLDPAIALDSEGQPRIAYSRDCYGAKYALYNGVDWEIEYIYEEYLVSSGWYDIVVDSGDISHVVFSGSHMPGPVYAVQDTTISGWTLDYLPVHATWMSLDLDSQEQPCIAILDNDEDNRFLFNEGTGWQVEFIEEGNDHFGSISLAMDGSDRAHVAYNSAATALHVKYAVRDTMGQWTISTVDSTLSSEPRGISLVLDQQDDPRISYNSSGELRYAAWNGLSWDVETVFSIDTGAYEYGTSLALDSEDNPHIAHCNSAVDSLLYSLNYGSGWETVRVAAIGDYGAGDPDIALDNADRPHIAFYSGHSDENLMYAFYDDTGIADPQLSPAQIPELSVSSNPFSEQLGISCNLTEVSDLDLLIYDIQGRLIKTVLSGQVAPGSHSASWIPDDTVPCGGYILVLRTSDTTVCSKVVYLK